MARILSGIQPSGSLHIGNYLAMMKPMIALQEENELFCFIVNYHALTSLSDPDKLRKNTVDAVLDFLALGLDPEKSYFWIQSDLPEVQELTWILSCNTSLGLLERSHSYKDKVAKGITPNSGLYTYPILMAADILLFQAEKVPVGKDQKQHLEITRDIASSFNANFGETFTLPDAVIEENLAVIPGIDGQKMSKSYDNTICMFEDEKKMRKRIMKIKTDSLGIEEPKNPDTCTIFALYKLFASTEDIASLRATYQAGGMGYGDAKQLLFEQIRDYFKPFREKREQLASDTEYVHKIMKMGAEKTRERAVQTLSLVRKKVGLNYL
ncbi:MAG: tryptophan--tRNA ligase [Spirochaetes bacterium]|jgi:tryptophanyl-tRNA synthetase|nr:tryptophan--tRNA ligase [Spirochaetota bacterium]